MGKTSSPPVPWYTSRTLWVGVGALLSNLLALLGSAGAVDLPEGWDGEVLAAWNGVLAVLAIAFRWKASAPLAASKRSASRSGVAFMLCGVLVLGLVSSGCVAFQPAGALNGPESTPSQQVWRTYGAPLLTATTLYEEAMREAGRLHALKAVSDDQLAAIRRAGRIAEAALEQARTGLLYYMTTEASRDPAPDLAKAQAAVTALLSLAEAAGVQK